MQKITTFLTYDSRAEEAANFYVGVFKNSKILTVTRYGDDAPLPKGTVLTVEFELEGQRFIALNASGSNFVFTDGVSLAVDCGTQAEVDELWDKLLAGGGEPVACGWLKDKFGLRWQVVPSVLAPLLSSPDSARANRVMQAMMKMIKLDIAELQRAAG
jgi:predicted 3-demethylubiquinone-9 3-methyltransferase (glyoxalase superfamily)